MAYIVRSLFVFYKICLTPLEADEIGEGGIEFEALLNGLLRARVDADEAMLGSSDEVAEHQQQQQRHHILLPVEEDEDMKRVPKQPKIDNFVIDLGFGHEPHFNQCQFGWEEGRGVTCLHDL